MTRSHDDIEVVTRLLEEKERDLELTAQIGKELLEQNQLLENRIIILEIELKTSNDNLAQLSHELHQKNELVSILTNDIDDNNSENGTPTAVKSINFELLQKKISILEEENKALRQEASQLAKDSVETEESDRKFMADITSQLYNTNTQYDDLRLELERQKDENLLQHEQIITITTRLMETELRLHQLTTENEEQSSMLCITKENQNLLAVELSDFKGRYQEVVALLSETQEQLRRIKKRNQPTGRICTAVSGGTNSQPLNDCLHFELLETTFSDNSLDSGISMDHRNPAAYKTAFETVRCASKSNLFADTMPHLGAMSMTSSSQPKMSAFATQNSVYKGTSSVFSGSNYQSFDIQPQPSTSMMGLKTFSRESLLSFEPEESYPAQAPCGTPGVPGAKDLEAALNRLTSAEVLARRTMLSHAPLGTYSYEDTQLPLGCRTPDSIMSTGLSTISCLSSQQWRLPEKLQIVKPMEGSQTLSHWSRLATPTLGGLLEERPGVRIRGGRGLDDLGLQIYSLSDVEEDFEDHPGKQFQSSSCVFTFTNSTVLHPDDGTLMFSVPPSQIASQITSQNSSRHSSAPQTPRACLSRRNSCSTFSVSLGLASMLYERGIKAVTPSALNTPCGLNYTPTVTPCNSPEGSPPRSMSPEPQFLTGLLSCGTDLLRRKILGDAEKQHKFRARNKITLTRLERRALRSIKILEKVESIGLNNIITTTSSSQQQSAVSPLGMQGSTNFYSSHSRSASPMAQLTSFKKFGTSEYKSDEVRIDRDAIRAILTKGLSCDSLKSLNDATAAAGSDGECGGTSSNVSSISTTSTNYNNYNNNNNNTINKPTSLSTSSTKKFPETGNEMINARVKHMQRQKSRRNLVTGGRQRTDLGTFGNTRPDLGTVANTTNNNKMNEEKTQPMGFVGTISSLLFGRKGGLL